MQHPNGRFFSQLGSKWSKPFSNISLPPSTYYCYIPRIAREICGGRAPWASRTWYITVRLGYVRSYQARRGMAGGDAWAWASVTERTDHWEKVTTLVLDTFSVCTTVCRTKIAKEIHLEICAQIGPFWAVRTRGGIYILKSFRPHKTLFTCLNPRVVDVCRNKSNEGSLFAIFVIGGELNMG